MNDKNERIINLFKELDNFKDVDGIEGYALKNLGVIDEAIESLKKIICLAKLLMYIIQN